MSLFKKILYFSLAFFILTFLFWGIYRLSFSRQETPAKNSEPAAPATPTQTVKKITALSDEAVTSPVFDEIKNLIKYYSKSSGMAYSIDTDGGSKKIINEKELPGLENALWSDSREKVITKFKNPSGEVQFFSYSYQDNKGVALKPNLDEVVWGAGGNKIYYKYFDSKTKKRTLSIADPDGSNWKDLADISYRSVMIAPVPQSGFVSFWNKPDAFAETTFETIPSLGGERKMVFREKFGANYLWDPSGNSLLVSHTKEKAGHQMQLATVNRNGGEYKNLDLPTFVSKCVWSKNEKFVYCAIPNGIPDNAILPNDYDNQKFNSVDTFWRVDVTTGEKSSLIDPKELPAKLDAANLFMNSDESALFFINRLDGKLWKIFL